MFCFFAFSKHLQSSFLAKNVLVINKALICCKKDCRFPFFRAIKMQTYVILIVYWITDVFRDGIYEKENHHKRHILFYWV